MTEAVTEAGAEARSEPWFQQPVSAHPAATVLLVGLIVAFPLLLFVFGTSQWFYLDDWDFVSARHATSAADLLRPHNENLSTLPILFYRAVFTLVRLHSYWPYQVAVVLAHLAAVALLWAVMRRSGVNQWVATLVAGLLILFGSGYQDIIWAFQIGFTGALAFGLGQLLLADHDGPLDRRDAFGLAMGVCALLCSGVGVTMVVAVGVACLLRRGWRAAAFHTVPLGVGYLVWSALAHPDGPVNPFHRSHTYVAGQVIRWDLDSLRYSFVDLAHWSGVAVVLGVGLVLGLAVAWIPLGRHLRRRQSMVIGCMVGAVVFASISGVGRWFFGIAYSQSSRYVYLVVALILPALAVAADALIQRWRWSTPLVVLALLAGVPANVAAFDKSDEVPGYARAAPEKYLALSQSALASRVPPAVQPDPLASPDLTAGWLAQAGRHGWLPQVAVSADAAADADLHLSLIQQRMAWPSTGQCQAVPRSIDLHLRRGSTLWQPAPPTTRTALLPSFSVRSIGTDGPGHDPTLIIYPGYGNLVRVEADLTARIKPVLGSSPFPLSICHS
jgi:hypothetical protein